MRFTKSLLCCTLGLSVMGCSMGRPLAYHTVSYNKSVEDAQNRTLMLNVVRASERRPMYFTGIGSITANPSYTLSSGKLNIKEEIKKTLDAMGMATPSDTNTDSFDFPSGSYSNESTLQVGVLDDQDFITGILSPVGIDTAAHYLEQGWRPDVLAFLLIERIETSTPEKLGLPKLSRNEAKKIIYNDPGTDFKEFQAAIGPLWDDHCEILNGQNKEPLLDIKKDQRLSDVVAAINAGIELGTQGTSMTVYGKSNSVIIRCFPRPTYSQSNPANFEAYIGAQNLEEAQRSKKATHAKLKPSIAFVLRSPHGVLYYLGEILREIAWTKGNVDERIPRIMNRDGTGEPIPLFWADRGDSACDVSALSVEYRGETYRIPGASRAEAVAPCTNRSMQALALASQLVGLHKSAKSLPETPLVRLIGGD